ncbi:MAG: hypothetical protein H0U76_00850 [Ktedonobacteraceae bacterium]|nr:hypothetical protein [Ktedonobacteraceae bacterium]
MSSLDKSIFRERAIEKYMRRREIHVVLRLVSPPMFFFLWGLLLLAVCGGAVVWSIQIPILVQGKGIVLQQAVPQQANTKQQETIVLLLLSPDQQENLKVGQSVTITIVGTNTSFTSTIGKVQPEVMSPMDIRTQFNVAAPLSQAISGPSVVAIAPVQPASLGHTYLGSQCESQVKIGSQSALSLVPVVNNFASYLDNAQKLFDTIRKEV